MFRLPHLLWAGLRHDDLERFGVPPGALQPLSAADEARAAALARSHGQEPDLAYEMERFLARREKMELEGVSGLGHSYLSDVFLPAKARELLGDGVVDDGVGATDA